MSEVPIPQDLVLSMSLTWNDEHGVFVLSYLEGDRALFQVKMTPQAFEKMTSDMVRTVKNYNLHQAQKYMEKANGQNLEGEALGFAGGLQDLSPSTESNQAQPEQS